MKQYRHMLYSKRRFTRLRARLLFEVYFQLSLFLQKIVIAANWMILWKTLEQWWNSMEDQNTSMMIP